MPRRLFESFQSSLKEYVRSRRLTASPNNWVTRYYNTEILSDAVISCEGQEFKVHRLILSIHSQYFTKELNGPCKEASDKKIEIGDFDAGVVEAMIQFMYKFDYRNKCGTSTMVFDAQVYQIADKYNIQALKTLSKEKFGASIATGWSMDDFPLAIAVVYDSTLPEDRGLRDLAVETSHENIEKLLGHDEFCKVLRKIPDFAADLIPFLSGKHTSNSKSYRCPSCSYTIHGDLRHGKNYYCTSCGSRNTNWDSWGVGSTQNGR
ncbi:BTB/POZ protein [Ilyonectria sp. MPI-CAGE-AT-0026]|nr:BTB/POZ protein [Ilyonectria sp. MPI-CAGE-AT-0026]